MYPGVAALLAAAAVAFQASAADLSAADGYKDYAPRAVWTGFYFGGNLGYGKSAWSDQLACADTGAGSCGQVNGVFGGLSPAGWLGGIQLGYNWQGAGSPLVFGLEADADASTILGQGSDGIETYKSRLQSVGTLRGRMGYGMDRALVYLTGGLAMGSVDNETATGTNNPNKIATGYTLGGGIEYKFKRDLSLKLEYQYINLGQNDTDPSSFAASGGTLHDDAFNTVRVGVNYFPFAAREALK
jgi:outer membrane immunogenic protein